MGLGSAANASSRARAAATSARAAQRERRLRESSDRRQDFLPRRRVGEATRRAYDRVVARFIEATKCPPSPTPSEVDRLLASFLTETYFAGAELREMRYSFYGIRWHYVLLSSELPAASAALQGFLRHHRGGMRNPLTWEEVVATAAETLRGGGIHGAEGAAWQLLTFDLYCRPADLLSCRGEDVAPPVGRRGLNRCWTVTFFPATQARRS